LKNSPFEEQVAFASGREEMGRFGEFSKHSPPLPLWKYEIVGLWDYENVADNPIIS
jgi:hypothetical protein